MGKPILFRSAFVLLLDADESGQLFVMPEWDVYGGFALLCSAMEGRASSVAKAIQAVVNDGGVEGMILFRKTCCISRLKRVQSVKCEPGA